MSGDVQLEKPDPVCSRGVTVVTCPCNAADVSHGVALVDVDEVVLSDLRGPGCSMDVLGVTCLYSAAAVCCEGAELVSGDVPSEKPDPVCSRGVTVVTCPCNAADVSHGVALVDVDELVLSELSDPGYSMDVLGATCLYSAAAVCREGTELMSDVLSSERLDSVCSRGVTRVACSPHAAEVSRNTAFAVEDDSSSSDLRGPGCSMDVLGVTCLYSAAAVCCEGAELVSGDIPPERPDPVCSRGVAVATCPYNAADDSQEVAPVVVDELVCCELPSEDPDPVRLGGVTVVTCSPNAADVSCKVDSAEMCVLSSSERLDSVCSRGATKVACSPNAAELSRNMAFAMEDDSSSDLSDPVGSRGVDVDSLDGHLPSV